VSAKVALVVGAGGIGSAVCDALANAATVVALDIAEDRAEGAARRVRERGGLAKAVRCDVSDPGDVEASLSAIERDFGPPSILVHAAGFGGPFRPVDEVPLDEWDRIIGTNLKSAFLLSKWHLPRMKARGFGRVVFIASVQGLFGARLSTAYVASKHGLVGFARALAAEWGEFGITCNAVCPGYVNTAMGAQPEARSGHLERILERTPSKRIAEPSEVASMVLYLVSDAARHVNGAALVIDGGITADIGI
jgi:3-oxoacyl-[acyl-carrier protein] reductase